MTLYRPRQSTACAAIQSVPTTDGRKPMRIGNFITLRPRLDMSIAEGSTSKFYSGRRSTPTAKNPLLRSRVIAVYGIGVRPLNLPP